MGFGLLLLVFRVPFVTGFLMGLMMTAFGKLAWPRLSKWEQARRVGYGRIKELSEEEFEDFLVDLFFRLGHKVKYEGRLVAERSGVRKLVVVAKGLESAASGELEKVAKWKNKLKCSQVILVNRRQFSDEVKRLAGGKRIQLWDGRSLVEAMMRVRRMVV